MCSFIHDERMLVWLSNADLFSNHVVTGIDHILHSKSSICDPICMHVHMYCQSCESQCNCTHVSNKHQQSSVLVVRSSFDNCSTLVVSSGSGCLWPASSGSGCLRPTGFMMLFWSSFGHSLPRHPSQIHGSKSAS